MSFNREAYLHHACTWNKRFLGSFLGFSYTRFFGVTGLGIECWIISYKNGVLQLGSELIVVTF